MKVSTRSVAGLTLHMLNLEQYYFVSAGLLRALALMEPCLDTGSTLGAPLTKETSTNWTEPRTEPWRQWRVLPIAQRGY